MNLNENSLVITVPIEIKLERIADLLCCAFEGGVGYWATIVDMTAPSKPKRYLGPAYCDYPITGGTITIRVDGEEPSSEPIGLYVLDLFAIDRGLKAMAVKYPHHFAAFMTENEDAATGDVFVQCCCFEEVRYG